jgi:hypothetical protein
MPAEEGAASVLTPHAYSRIQDFVRKDDENQVMFKTAHAPCQIHGSLVALQIASGLIKNTEVPEGSYEE